MKRILLAVVMILVFTGVSYAVETTLDAPLVIMKPATKMIQYSFTVIPSENKVIATMQWKDTDGLPIANQKTCEFVDPAVTNAIIQAGKVGQKYIDVMSGFIQTKCKGLWGLTGTDN